MTGTFGKNEKVKNVYLNMRDQYPDHKFTVVIFESDLPKFPENPVIFYKDKSICVQGKISFYKEKPKIVAKNEEQIEVVDC